jgi:3-oxoacyl-[acyl-carrier protein] reductase
VDLRLEGRTAFVTGSSSGIGAAVARVLAGEGVDVAVGYGSNADGANRVVRDVEATGRHGLPVRLDVTDPDSVAAAVDAVQRWRGGLDVLVLSAGIDDTVPFVDLDWARWRRVVDTNLGGTFLVLAAARPLLRDGAAVVTLGSVAGATGQHDNAHYATSKAGIVGLTKSAARALAPRVRVNCVAPGLTVTPMGDRIAAHMPEDYIATRLLADRHATAEEVARLVTVLASPISASVYGATLDVNGGRDLR